MGGKKNQRKKKRLGLEKNTDHQKEGGKTVGEGHTSRIEQTDAKNKSEKMRKSKGKDNINHVGRRGKKEKKLSCEYKKLKFSKTYFGCEKDKREKATKAGNKRRGENLVPNESSVGERKKTTDHGKEVVQTRTRQKGKKVLLR